MNVLEVMDEAARLHMDNLDEIAAREMTQARAAVAELIEAHKALITFSWDWFSECIDDEDRFEEREAIKNARAALAKATP